MRRPWRRQWQLSPSSARRSGSLDMAGAVASKEASKGAAGAAARARSLSVRDIRGSEMTPGTATTPRHAPGRETSRPGPGRGCHRRRQTWLPSIAEDGACSYPLVAGLSAGSFSRLMWHSPSLVQTSWPISRWHGGGSLRHAAAVPSGPEDPAGGATCWQPHSDGYGSGGHLIITFTSHSGGTSLFAYISHSGGTWRQGARRGGSGTM